MSEPLGTGGSVRLQLVLTVGKTETISGHKYVGGERRSPGLPAARTMTIVGPQGILRQFVTHGTAKAATRYVHGSPPAAQRRGDERRHTGARSRWRHLSRPA